MLSPLSHKNDYLMFHSSGNLDHAYTLEYTISVGCHDFDITAT